MTTGATSDGLGFSAWVLGKISLFLLASFAGVGGLVSAISAGFFSGSVRSIEVSSVFGVGFCFSAVFGVSVDLFLSG